MFKVFVMFRCGVYWGVNYERRVFYILGFGFEECLLSVGGERERRQKKREGEQRKEGEDEDGYDLGMDRKGRKQGDVFGLFLFYILLGVGEDISFGVRYASV